MGAFRWRTGWMVVVMACGLTGPPSAEEAVISYMERCTTTPINSEDVLEDALSYFDAAEVSADCLRCLTGERCFCGSRCNLDAFVCENRLSSYDGYRDVGPEDVYFSDGSFVERFQGFTGSRTVSGWSCDGARSPGINDLSTSETWLLEFDILEGLGRWDLEDGGWTEPYRRVRKQVAVMGQSVELGAGCDMNDAGCAGWRSPAFVQVDVKDRCSTSRRYYSLSNPNEALLCPGGTLELGDSGSYRIDVGWVDLDGAPTPSWYSVTSAFANGGAVFCEAGVVPCTAYVDVEPGDAVVLGYPIDPDELQTWWGSTVTPVLPQMRVTWAPR